MTDFHQVEDINKKYNIAFGAHLHDLMARHGRDVVTVASIGNIEQKQVYRVLKGEHAASLRTIIALAKGVGVKPKDLFDFDFDLE
ncbi:MAG: hypothetical protein CFE23_14860 [Flavobacterium sp. BFFFF1]|uniref:helix-turn-helix domain-containing protein n=1 Tax=unclassified Flavobacterium TaxID=196869 RepID=UPI000BC7D200|nr:MULTISPECIES: helix-turn-helix domain-containing protein [unclassified Flavobacterium]OYU79265.1 MAG: hypothetical protein CFE23_14860 [Flavobacterium sp. BFFFF1]